jgi:DNA polymerase-3 subunit delta
MVAAKAQEADRIVARPPQGTCCFLVYGPDAGLVAERAQKLANAAADPADPFSFIRLEAGEVASDPSRLADEAYAVSMFGGRRAILVRDAGSRATLAPIVARLLADPPPETVIVLEAGDLKKSNPIRTLVERDRSAYAIPCYVDDDAAIGRLVDEEAKANGLAVSPDARAALVSQLGGDRLISRGEIQKLCLYARGSGRIELKDVEALIGDSAGIAADEIVDAAATGDLSGLTASLGRAATEGLDPGQIAASALRHFQMLDEARGAVDAGRRPADVVEGLRPPVFFKRKDKVAAALGVWSAPRLEKALSLLSDAVRDARLNQALAPEIVGDTLLTIARAAGSGARARR